MNGKTEGIIKESLDFLDDPSDVYSWGKVIGNIHDNPELMEGG